MSICLQPAARLFHSSGPAATKHWSSKLLYVCLATQSVMYCRVMCGVIWNFFSVYVAERRYRFACGMWLCSVDLPVDAVERRDCHWSRSATSVSRIIWDHQRRWKTDIGKSDLLFFWLDPRRSWRINFRKFLMQLHKLSLTLESMIGAWHTPEDMSYTG